MEGGKRRGKVRVGRKRVGEIQDFGSGVDKRL